MSNARKVVVRLLGRMDDNAAYSNIILDKGLASSLLDAQDKKFATALFYGTLERKLTLDAIIKLYCTRPSDKLGTEINNIIRIALYQILYMDSVPDSAAVDESVKLAKGLRNPSASGFVNGLLRSFLRDGAKLPEGKSSVEDLSLKFSCPQWLVKKWLNEYGGLVTENMLETSVGKAPVTVKANTLKAPLEDIMDTLNADGITCEIIDYLPDCLHISGSGAIENSNAYKNGLCHVQDISSQLCCYALAAKAGETVVDLCSAPGGKAFTICENMNDDGELFAFDLHESRVRLIRAGAYRLGLKSIKATTNDAKKFNESIPMADRVLCDVPCSGLGVIRRKPEIKYKNPEEFERLPQIQYDILETSGKYVKAGGILVYSTCTVSRAENEDVVEKFLKNHKEFVPCELPKLLTGENGKHCIQITPDKFGSDGFFIAKLKKLEV